MKLFVYESITSGGMLGVSPQQIPASLLQEGRAMRNCLLTDLESAGYELLTLTDSRLVTDAPAVDFHALANDSTPVNASNYVEAFKRFSSEADFTIAIAPEIDQELFRCTAAVLAAGGKSLGPELQTIELCSDKLRTTEYLRSQRIAASETRSFDSNSASETLLKNLPLVLKPRFGAGSQDTYLIRSKHDFSQRVLSEVRLKSSQISWCVEPYVPGIAASVAFLCGPAQICSLPPCLQHLNCPQSSGVFCYLGGEFPLPNAGLQQRATRLATQAIEALANFGHKLCGYLGVDLVLGPADDGSEDCVIEINPRLTTSYIVLSAACKQNLGAALVAIAQGEKVELQFDSIRREFTSSGIISPLSTS